MGEFAECLNGIKEACEFLNYPVVSGNVSFYNGTNNKNIYPTPVIGGVGLLNKLKKPLGHNFKKVKSNLVLIGKTFGHLGQSCFLKENYSLIEGNPPEINLLSEKNNGKIVFELIDKDLALSCHDISNGGLIVTLSEMAMSTDIGVKVENPKKLRNFIEYLFGEDQGRYVLEIDNKNIQKVEKLLKENNIYYEYIGETQEKFFEIVGEMKLDVNDLFKVNNQWYNSY